MKPKLPRELLWRDLETLDEFYKLDPINHYFFDVLRTLSDDYFSAEEDGVSIFNEVYYQSTRIVYENPIGSDFWNYVFDIKDSLKWKYCATLIMSITYPLIMLRDEKERPINKAFLKMVKSTFGGPMYWQRFQILYRGLRRDGFRIKYDFQPIPKPASFLKTQYVDWSHITNDFDIDIIKQVVALWKDENDQQEIARLIENYLKIDNLIDTRAVYKTIRLMEEECKNLRRKNADLEAAIEQSKCTQNGNLTEDYTRTFSLQELVNYCKECDDWDDVKNLKLMLYGLLSNVGGKREEYELINSIKKKPSLPQNNFNFEIVQNNETNIDSNYGPNIEHNGGTLSLPEMKI